MLTSLLLALLVLALSWISAWAVGHFGRKAGESPTKLQRIRLGFTIGGAVLAVYAFYADFGLRKTTLFEALIEGSKDAGSEVEREASFTIEHANVRHKLLVVPLLGLGEEAAIPVHLRISLHGPDDAVWVDERALFDLRSETSTTRGGTVSRTIWDSRTWEFTPERIGLAKLRIVLENPGVHKVHIRVEDPEKTDGVRAPGY